MLISVGVSIGMIEDSCIFLQRVLDLKGKSPGNVFASIVSQKSHSALGKKILSPDDGQLKCRRSTVSDLKFLEILKLRKAKYAVMVGLYW